MAIPDDVLTATQARFKARRGPRAGTEEKIAEAHTPQGSILNVDSTERVELRSRRVMRQPVVADALRATADTSPAALGQVRDEVVLERIIGGNNLLGIAFLELGTAVSRSVGRIIVRDRFQIRSFGTGFMISPRLALTNNHVLADAQSARFSRLEFNFQNGLSGLPLAASQFDLEPDTFFRTDAGLDVTVIAVAAASRPDGAGASVPLAGFGFNRTPGNRARSCWANPSTSSSTRKARRNSSRCSRTNSSTALTSSCTTTRTHRRAPPVHRCSTTSGKCWASTIRASRPAMQQEKS